MTAALVDAPRIRRQLERLAERVLAGLVPDRVLPVLLGELVPGLPGEERLARFESLVEAIVLRDTHLAGQQVVTDALDAFMSAAAR